MLHHCQNCGEKFTGTDNTCPDCGQKVQPAQSAQTSFGETALSTKILLGVLVILLGYYFFKLGTDPYMRPDKKKTSNAAVSQKADPYEGYTKEEREASTVIGDKPRNSEWDGAVKPVVDWIKSNANDPYSIKYQEWSPVELLNTGDGKYWGVRCRFSVKNAFGAYMTYEKLFLMQNGVVVDVKDYGS